MTNTQKQTATNYVMTTAGPAELAMLKSHALNTLSVSPGNVEACDKMLLLQEIERLRNLANGPGCEGAGTMTADESVENPTWAANLALWSALGILAKTGFGDDCCDNDGCCMFYGSAAIDIEPRSDGLAKPLTFAEAAELERKAVMFEDISRVIREVLAKFPPQ